LAASGGEEAVEVAGDGGEGDVEVGVGWDAGGGASRPRSTPYSKSVIALWSSKKYVESGPNMWITGMLRLGGLDRHDKERIVLGGVTGRRTR
jgi:hypothetical protein